MSEREKLFLLEDDGVFPNHSRWPLIVYPAVFSLRSDDSALEVEKLVRKNRWGSTWRNGIYGFQHYHSRTHECLAVYRGTALVQFGGPRGPQLELHVGDVAVLPAGTAHMNLGSSPDFGVLGAYPRGVRYDLCRGTPEERAMAIAAIQEVPKPETDPVFGFRGGLIDHWRD
jgi:uncharacterized protein YjlB